jgi:hypothetical protein
VVPGATRSHEPRFTTEDEALLRRHEQYTKWFPRDARRFGNAFDVPLVNGEEHFRKDELPEVYHPIRETLIAWRYFVAQHIDDTENVQGNILPDGMNDLHLNVKSVIGTEKVLKYARGVGRLDLVKGLMK